MYDQKRDQRNINNLKYADDTTLMVESEEELKKKKNYVYLFILLPQGLSYSMRIFSYGMLALGCGMYDLVP